MVVCGVTCVRISSSCLCVRPENEQSRRESVPPTCATRSHIKKRPHCAVIIAGCRPSLRSAHRPWTRRYNPGLPSRRWAPIARPIRVGAAPSGLPPAFTTNATICLAPVRAQGNEDKQRGRNSDSSSRGDATKKGQGMCKSTMPYLQKALQSHLDYVHHWIELAQIAP